MLPSFRNRVLMIIAAFLSMVFVVNAQLKDSIAGKKSKLPLSDFYRVRNGLPHFYKKINKGEYVTVAFLGGSITYNPGWRPMVCDYLVKQFPNVKFHFIAAGIPSLGSLPHVFRLQQSYLQKPFLYQYVPSHLPVHPHHNLQVILPAIQGIP